MQTEETAESILDAARRAVASFGLQRLRIEDVAQQAGVTRQTVYRHYGNKDRLLKRMLAREVSRLLDEIASLLGRFSDLRSLTREIILRSLEFLEDHAMFQRLMATEPEVLLVFLAKDAGPTLARGRKLLRAMIGNHHPNVDHGLLDTATDALVRLVISYGVSPSDAPSSAIADTLARVFCDGVLSQDSPQLTPITPGSR